MRRNVGGYHPGAYFFAKLLVETPIDMLFQLRLARSFHDGRVRISQEERIRFNFSFTQQFGGVGFVFLIAPASETAGHRALYDGTVNHARRAAGAFVECKR